LSVIKILHTSNICLDHVLTDYHKGVRKDKRIELLESFDFIVNKAIQLEVNALLIAGGIISAGSVSLSTLDRIKAGFSRLTEKGIHVIAVPGCSDEKSDISILKELFSNKFMCFFSDEKWSVYQDIEGVNIYGIRSTFNRKNDNCLKDLVVGSDKVEIGILYGTFYQTPVTTKISPITSQDLIKSNLDYLALGHYENVVNCSVGKNICWYSGSPVHYSFNTFGERHVLLVSFKGKDAKVSRIKVPSRLQRVVHMDLNGKSFAQISQYVKRMTNTQLCLRVELDGVWNPVNAQLAKDLEDMLCDEFFHFEVCDNTLFEYTENILNFYEGRKSKDRDSGKKRGHDLSQIFLGKVQYTDNEQIDNYSYCTNKTGTDNELNIMASKLGLIALREVYEHENRKVVSMS